MSCEGAKRVFRISENAVLSLKNTISYASFYESCLLSSFKIRLKTMLWEMHNGEDEGDL